MRCFDDDDCDCDEDEEDRGRGSNVLSAIRRLRRCMGCAG